MAVEGKLKTAEALDDKAIAAIREQFEKQVGEEISFEIKVDPTLLGGFVVTLGGKVYDNSVRAHLKNIKSYIHNTAKTACDPEDDEDGSIELHFDTKIFGDETRARIGDYIDLPDTTGIGTVVSSGDGIVIIEGLEGCKYGELVVFENATGIVMNLSLERIGAVLLSNASEVSQGSTVRKTGAVVRVPVGDALLGRVIDPLGEPIDGKGAVCAVKFRPIEAEAPAIFDRQGVKQPLETGIMSIDCMIPIGKGQRELIIGDRQTGKTAIAVDTILNQKGKHVYCVYVAIGQKASTVSTIIHTLEMEGAMDYTVVVASTGSDTPSMQYIAPYAGCAIAEEFMYTGRDVLIVYDDLSKHAVAYRTMSLLLRRPPGREAYPGDVFYLHSRLLERASKLSAENGGGSMTALPIIETMAGDISAYIPTNVISITDGQIYLESELFNAGIRPAVNVGLSVSRVGGSAQVKAMRKVAGRLRLDLAQYRELAVFAQFASDLDKMTRDALDQGAKLTETLKQPQYVSMPMASQVITLFAAVNKYLIGLPIKLVGEFKAGYLKYVDDHYPEVRIGIGQTGDLTDEMVTSLHKAAQDYLALFREQNSIQRMEEA